VTEQLSRNEALARKAAEQVNYIASAFAEQGSPIKTEFATDGGAGFTYAEGQILVRDAYLERVQNHPGAADRPCPCQPHYRGRRAPVSCRSQET
jgi:hypothetical protein